MLEVMVEPAIVNKKKGYLVTLPGGARGFVEELEMPKKDEPVKKAPAKKSKSKKEEE